MSLLFATVMTVMTGTPTMEQVIDKVNVDQINAGETVQPPLSRVQIDEVIQDAWQQLAVTIPADFVAFLGRAAGVDYNGVVIYGGNQSPEKRGPGGFWQGLVTANRMWQADGESNWLVIGETDMDLLTVDKDGTGAVLRDKVSHDVNERFESIREMITAVLNRRL